jgi:hypothetical protein
MVSTRTAPELDRAVGLARDIRSSGAAVTIVAHEHEWLGRASRSPSSCALPTIG